VYALYIKIWGGLNVRVLGKGEIEVDAREAKKNVKEARWLKKET